MDGELETRYYAINRTPKYDDSPRNNPLKDLKFPIRPSIAAFVIFLPSEKVEYTLEIISL